MLIKNKTAIVTGGSGLLGSAICKLLAEHGAQICVHYFKRKSNAEKLVQQIQSSGGRAFAFCADIRDQRHVQKMIDQTVKQFGTVDILINNASTVPPEIGMKSFLKHTWKDYEAYIDTVLKGTFHTCTSVLPIMSQKKSGRIINISTTALHEINYHLNPYITAKGGLLGMTRSLAEEFGKFNITVNQVAPGWIWPENPASLKEDDGKVFRERSPLGIGLAEPADVAGAVLFLASDLAKNITSAYLPVCAGQIKG